MSGNETIDGEYFDFTDSAEPTEFTVFRDGEIDADFYRAMAKQMARERRVQAVQRVVRGVGEYVSYVAGNINTELRVVAHDVIYRTNYRQQRFEAWEQAREQRFAARIGLVAVDKHER